VPTSAAASATLNVPWVAQEQSAWCWAACCDMVFRYYAVPNVRQCDMAAYLFGGNCCATPSSTVCNRFATSAQIINVYNHWVVNCSYVMAAFSFAALQSEIALNRPLEPALFWGGTGVAHTVIVKGWYDSPQLVYVNAPVNGAGYVRYSDLLSAYGAGTWGGTFYNLRM